MIGTFTQEEVRQTFKGCGFDEASTITALSAKERDRQELAVMETVNMEILLEEFRHSIDGPTVLSILRECGGDVNSTRLLLHEMFPLDQSEQDASTGQTGSTASHHELQFYVNHIVVVFNGRVDMEMAQHALDECNHDLSTAIATLTEVYGAPSFLFLFDATDIQPAATGELYAPSSTRQLSASMSLIPSCLGPKHGVS